MALDAMQAGPSNGGQRAAAAGINGSGGEAAPVALLQRQRRSALTADQRREISGLLPGLAVHTCVLLFVGCSHEHCDSPWLRAQLPLVVATALLELAAVWAWPALSTPPLRLPRCVVGRLLFCGAFACQNIGAGMGRALERPPLPGPHGALVDAVRTLIGTGVPTIMAQGSYASLPPAGQLLLQLALLALTWKPRAVCASPLLAAPLSRRRLAQAAAALEVLAQPLAWLTPARFTSGAGLSRDALFSERADPEHTCVAVVGYGQALVGLLPVLLAAQRPTWADRAWQPQAPWWLALPWARADAALRWAAHVHHLDGKCVLRAWALCALLWLVCKVGL